MVLPQRHAAKNESGVVVQALDRKTLRILLEACVHALQARSQNMAQQGYILGNILPSKWVVASDRAEEVKY